MATCNDCLHNDACIDMLQALGFIADGDGYFADRRCNTFKDKNRYVELKHGRWDAGCCTVCGCDWGKIAPIAPEPNFCPDCGANINKNNGRKL